MMTWSQVGLQDAASPVMEEFLFFHDFTLVVLVFITSFVGYLLVGLSNNPWMNTGLLEGQTIECIWTLIPALILVQVAIPSLLLLYMLDEGYLSGGFTIKVIGHQWYWSYEYTDAWALSESGGSGATQSGHRLETEAYMLSDSGKEDIRLLDADSAVILPFGTQVQALVGASDVLHSWALPSMGVKADACPGRLNQVKFVSHRPGVYYGQCSEICGANHSFMPIMVCMMSAEDVLASCWASANC